MSGQPVPVFNHHHNNITFFLNVWTEFPVFLFIPIVSFALAGHRWEESVFTFLTLTHASQVFISDPWTRQSLSLAIKSCQFRFAPRPKIYKVYIVNCLLDFGLCCPCLPFALLNFHSCFFLPASVGRGLLRGERKCYTTQTKLHEKEYCLKLQYFGV